MKNRRMILQLSMEDAVRIDKYLARYADSCLKQSKELTEEFVRVGDVLDKLEDAMNTADVIKEGSTGATTTSPKTPY